MNRALPAALVLAAALSGCGSAPSPSGAGPSPSAPTVSHTRGLPPDVTSTDSPGESVVGWAGPGRMYVVTYGSSSCPRLPNAVTAATGNRLTIATNAASDGPCTMDFGPTTSVVDVPQEIDETMPVEVILDGVSSAVPPR